MDNPNGTRRRKSIKCGPRPAWFWRGAGFGETSKHILWYLKIPKIQLLFFEVNNFLLLNLFILGSKFVCPGIKKKFLSTLSYFILLLLMFSSIFSFNANYVIIFISPLNFASFCIFSASCWVRNFFYILS